MIRKADDLEPWQRILDLPLFITIIALLLLGILFMGTAEFLLVMGATLILVCIGIYFYGEPEARAILIIIFPMAVLMLLMYFFG
jgi:hypothetical protein